MSFSPRTAVNVSSCSRRASSREGSIESDGIEADRRWIIEPTRALVARFRDQHPDVPVIGFPRGAGLYYSDYAADTGVSAIGLDTTVPTAWAAEHLQPKLTVQGNLDPMLLLVGGAAMEEGVRVILDDLGQGPLVFNLGHGIVKETPPDHVAALVAAVRGDTA